MPDGRPITMDGHEWPDRDSAQAEVGGSGVFFKKGDKKLKFEKGEPDGFCYIFLEFMFHKLFKIQTFFKYKIYSAYSYVCI
jgi:hypothetical protein